MSPGRRVAKDVAIEAIFPGRDPAAASRALSTALSNGRTALAPLGQLAAGFLRADRTYIWADPACRLEIDLELHKQRLSGALGAEPGLERDDLLVLALADEGTLLEDERYADWAILPREELERSRHDARLALARDRARGFGCCSPEAVAHAWEACFSKDPVCEEAACALMRLYAAQTRWALVESTYRRCISSLGDLGFQSFAGCRGDPRRPHSRPPPARQRKSTNSSCNAVRNTSNEP